MGRDFFRLVELAIASGALIIPGVVRADDTSGAKHHARAAAGRPAFIVESATLDRDGLVIQFSKPLRTPETVDPNKFRLTFAYYSKNRPGGYYYYHQYYSARRAVTSYEDISAKTLGAQVDRLTPKTVRIRASRMLNLSSICTEIADSSTTAERMGLYLHYAQAGARQVASADGEALASIAPYWLAKADAPSRSGSFEGRPIPVRVRCR